MDDYTNLGVAAIIALIILKFFIEFYRSLSSTKETLPPNHQEETLADLKNKVDSLYEWHSIKDSDGVFIWYVRRSLEETLKDLTCAIESQTAVIQQLLFSLSLKSGMNLTKKGD